jgi:lysophospholipase L1-like esterase
MLGINELGTGSAVTFTKQYEKVIGTIKKLQPDAIIYIESIMNIAKEKSDTDPIYNNVNIKKRNDHLLKLADDTKVFYLNINEAVTDKNGYLHSKYTFDYIHLKAAYYKLWTDYLLTHGVVDESGISQ